MYHEQDVIQSLPIITLIFFHLQKGDIIQNKS